MKIKWYLLGCCLMLTLTGCGKDSVDANHEHKFAMQYQSSSTCKEAGKRVDKCSCGQTQTIILEKAEHNYKERITKRATCLAPGEKIQKCSVCSEEIVEEIPMLEHNWKTSQKTTPSCSVAGVETRKCDRCNTVEEVESPAKEHTFHKVTISATCTEKGKEQNECWFCDEIEVLKELPMIQHEWENKEKKPSTCTEDGQLEKTCIHCKKKETSVLPKIDHSFVEEEKKATCVEDGYKKMVCEGCGLVMDEVVYVSPGHSSRTKTVVPATCSAPGLLEHTCVVCKLVEQEEIEPLDHKFSTYEKDPTCVVAGYKTRKCDVCGQVDSHQDKPALGHKNIELRRVEPTCTQTGYIERVCSVCLEVTTETLPTQQHNYELVAEDSEWRHFECSVCHSTKKEKK